ncbi:putative histone H2A.6 [Dichanthelium oligosanthes]|uniref:Histone H2A n=1 Tax=Dichanthelium oligosanthes TaxID=888268 RepID=A0A1E5UW78_9POAL|nr:putative histone H2A.6 [Dichanthelium oligosanthes]
MDTSGAGGKAKKGVAGRKVDGPKKKSVLRSVKAGLQFPIGRIWRYLKKGCYAQRVGTGAPIYLTAVLEYLAAEVLELASNAVGDNKKKRIIPRHVLLAIHNDEELGSRWPASPSPTAASSRTSTRCSWPRRWRRRRVYAEQRGVEGKRGARYSYPQGYDGFGRELSYLSNRVDVIDTRT